jgi:hypothetical protein
VGSKVGPPEPPKPTGDRWKDQRALEDHERAVEANAKWKDPRAFLQAGADRNAMRHASSDGLRLLAWIAKFVPPGGDPVKTLVQIASEAGFDVDPSDLTWAFDETATDEAATG